MSTATEAVVEFHRLVPPDYWWRIDVDHESGCWRAVRGPRSGVESRYPAVAGGRLLHRVLWEAEHGPTTDLLVRSCRDSLCVRPAHVVPMSWVEMHHHHAASWANRGSSSPPPAPSGPNAPQPPPEDVSERHSAHTARDPDPDGR